MHAGAVENSTLLQAIDHHSQWKDSQAWEERLGLLLAMKVIWHYLGSMHITWHADSPLKACMHACVGALLYPTGTLSMLSITQVALEHHRDRDFAVESAKLALQLLGAPETRVRTAVAVCLGAAAGTAGADIWKLAEKPVLDLIDCCWVASSSISPPDPRSRTIQCKCFQYSGMHVCCPADWLQTI